MQIKQLKLQSQNNITEKTVCDSEKSKIKISLQIS